MNITIITTNMENKNQYNIIKNIVLMTTNSEQENINIKLLKP
jgi:hypothetical protein